MSVCIFIDTPKCKMVAQKSCLVGGSVVCGKLFILSGD